MTNTTVLLRGAQSADGRAMYTQGDSLQFGSFYLGESSSTSGSTEATGMQIISRSLEDADIPADVTNVIMHPGDTVLTSSMTTTSQIECSFAVKGRLTLRPTLKGLLMFLNLLYRNIQLDLQFRILILVLERIQIMSRSVTVSDNER